MRKTWTVWLYNKYFVFRMKTMHACWQQGCWIKDTWLVPWRYTDITDSIVTSKETRDVATVTDAVVDAEDKAIYNANVNGPLLIIKCGWSDEIGGRGLFPPFSRRFVMNFGNGSFGLFPAQESTFFDYHFVPKFYPVSHFWTEFLERQFAAEVQERPRLLVPLPLHLRVAVGGKIWVAEFCEVCEWFRHHLRNFL